MHLEYNTCNRLPFSFAIDSSFGDVSLEFIAKLKIGGCVTQFWRRKNVTFKDWVYSCYACTCSFKYMYASTYLAFHFNEAFQDRLPMA